jgi:hypothetical protein
LDGARRGVTFRPHLKRAPIGRIDDKQGSQEYE